MYNEETIRTKFYKCMAIIIGLGLLFIFALMLITLPVEARTTFNSTLNITDITDTSITWHYEYLTANRPIGASLDGVEIQDFKTDYVYNYTANELKPNTSHEFCIYGQVSSNCEKGTTLTASDSGTKLFNLIYLFIFFLISLACLAISTRSNESKYLAVAGFIIAMVGYALTLNQSFYMGILFMIEMITALFVAFKD